MARFSAVGSMRYMTGTYVYQLDKLLSCAELTDVGDAVSRGVDVEMDGDPPLPQVADS